MTKSFRTELTRKILQANNHPPEDINLMNKNIIFNSTNFPPPPLPRSIALPNSPMLAKLDELVNKLSEVTNHLTNLEVKQDKFEHYILEENRIDENVTKNIDNVSNNQIKLKKDVTQHSLYIERHENMFCKLLIPMFEDLISFIAKLNYDF